MTAPPEDERVGASQKPVVEMRGIVKHFPGVLANDHISLDLEPGEILGLLGENGAGKTTLMNILYGFYQADSGQILVRSEEVHFRSSQDAIAHGLGMVHQHFMLVEVFTVAENMVLGQPSPRRPLLEDPRAVAARIRALSERYGLEVDPDAYIWQLSVGQQQRVEILKALYRGAQILILDEPTAVLTPQETDELLAIMRALADDGRSLIFISHKLHEVSSVCDRVAVLRDGQVVEVVGPHTPTAEMARMMVGRDVLLRVEKETAHPGEVLLSVRDLWVRDDQDNVALRGLDLDVRSGEIVGIAGVAGNGQRELEDAVCGLRSPDKGQITLCQKDTTTASPAEVIAVGMGHIPSDRYGVGLVGDFSVAENLVLEAFWRPPFTRHGLLRVATVNAHAKALAHTYDIRTPSIATSASKLSGGNAQKLILARELYRNPRVLLAAQPTRGLDVGATEYVHKELVRQRDQGMGILLISTELEEILALSDRIVVLCEGRITGEQASPGVDVGKLGLMMAGTSQSEA